MWIKWRTKWSSGPGDWDYEWLHDSWSDSDIQDFFDTKQLDYIYESDAYRGFEWEKSLAPIPVIQRKIREIQGDIDRSNIFLEQMLEQLDEAEGGNLGNRLEEARRLEVTAEWECIIQKARNTGVTADIRIDIKEFVNKANGLVNKDRAARMFKEILNARIQK